ncbi:MAG: MFS transporter [Deltaproteobacteria bacterium]|jgi:MFS family permease|nr:MFS transporter [Deltaproteobacteria bacterium]
MKIKNTDTYFFETQNGVAKLWTAGFRAFLCLNVFIFLGFDVLLPTLTLYLEGHGHSRDAIGRIFSFFMIAAIIMRMMAPRLVLLVRPFLLVRLGLLIGSLAVVGYYFGHSAPAASTARFFHGLGFGITSTILTAMAAQTIPAPKMAQGMGFLGLGTILTLALGPSLGIWLKDHLGYLPLFLTVAGIYLAGLLWTLKMPDLKLSAPPEGQKRPKLVLLSRLALAPSFLMFMIGISISSVAIYIALYFNEMGLAYSGRFFGLSTIGILIARVFAGRIQDRHGHRWVLTPAIILMTTSVLMIPRVTGPVSLFLAAVMWGLSTGSLFPSVQAMSFSSVPAHGRTEVASSVFNAFDLGMGTGSVVFGLLCEYFHTYRAAYWGNTVNLLGLLAFYLIYYFALHPEHPRTSKKPV